MKSTDAVLPERPARIRLVPAHVDTDGPDAAYLASSYGLTPDDWQADVLNGMLAYRPDGRYAAARAGVAVPRQNGKNGIIEMRELFGMVVLGEKFLHTAHEVKTARKAFLRLLSFFENPRQYPELAKLVAPGGIRKTNGQEAIVLTNGGSIEFVARTKGSGRGFTVDVLVFDEAQELSDETLAALLPTVSAAPLGNPQQIYTGTPPSGNMNGEVWTRVRQAGVSGSDERLAYYEWSAEEGVDLDDPAVWHAVNPALGIRLNIDTVLSERASMDDESFGRERLGMWEGEHGNAVIPVDAWAACADEHSEPTSQMVLAVDVTPDRTAASIAVAGLRTDGRWHVELIDNRRGTGWVASRLAEIGTRHGIRTVVLDGASPAASLEEAIRAKRRLAVVKTGPRDMAAACGEFYDAVMDERVAHIDQPLLTHALTQSRKRRLGDAWAWNRSTAASDISPVVAATLALWGAQSSRVRRKKRTGSPARKVVIL